MKIAVTGGAGQLGTVVIRKLLADRSIKEIRCLDLRPPSIASFRVTSVPIDVRDPNVAQHFDGCDAVFHLAFVVAGWRPRAEFDDVNVGGSKNVFRAAAAAGVKQIIYSSSIAAYGLVPGHPNPIVETTPRRHQAEFAYSACKWEVEDFLDGFEREHPEIAVVRLRPGILVGERMENPLGELLRKNVMPDSGGAPLPLVWDEDVADAATLAFKKRARGAFNVVAGEPIAAADAARAAGLRRVQLPRPVVKALVHGVHLLARARKRPAFDPAWISQADIEMVVSSAKARADLGWAPKFPTARDVIRHHAEVAPHRLDPRLAFFFKLIAVATRRTPLPDEVKHVRTQIHLLLSGRRGGDVAFYIADGRMRVERKLPRPPSSVVRISAEDFLDLLLGRVDYATLTLTGRLKIEGEPTAGMVLQGVVTTFRTRTARLFKLAKLFQRARTGRRVSPGPSER